MRKIIDYRPELKIQNLDAIPKGTGAKYLLCVESPFPNEYVAKAWKRTIPERTGRAEVIIRF